MMRCSHWTNYSTPAEVSEAACWSTTADGYSYTAATTRSTATAEQLSVDYINETLVAAYSLLHEMLKNNAPKEVINSSGSKDMSVLFVLVLHYARYAAPKEQLKNEMSKEVMNAGALEGDHLHKCHLDFFDDLL